MTVNSSTETRIKALVRPASSVMNKKRSELVGESAAGGESTHIFPQDLGSHFMAFMFHRFHYQNQTLSKVQKFIRTILLPIPTNIQEQIQTQYNTPELGAIGGEISDMIARTGSKTISTGLGSILEEAGDLIGSVWSGDITGMFEEGGEGEKGNKLAQAGALMLRGGQGKVAAGINRYFASAPNPHITALFQGVGLRTHNFTWKLSPRNDGESIKLAKIINAFRGSMLPERAAGNLTLMFPDEVDIYIAGSEDQYLYHFKRAVIRNMTTNFAPDGVPSFFAKTGAPSAVSINLDLLETTVHTRRDYEDVQSDVAKTGVADAQKLAEKAITENNLLAAKPDGR